jgi:small subunit ribosomal protein S9
MDNDSDGQKIEMGSKAPSLGGVDRAVGKYLLGIGRRKSASAQVRISESAEEKGIFVNGHDYKIYFPTYEWQRIIDEPLHVAGLETNFAVSAVVNGGGKQAQAESIRLGISRALLKHESALRKVLKPRGLLTRDPRVKERKKPGLKRARRAPQWQKR